MNFGANLRAVSLERATFWFYGLFLAGYFLFPQPPEHYKFYYVFVVIPVLFQWSKVFRQLKDNPLFHLLTIYVLYMVMSSLWSEAFEWPAFGRVAWYAVLVLSFFFATALVVRACPRDFNIMLRALVGLAALTGLVSVFVWYAKHPFPQSRLEPISRMDHSILAGCAYGFFAVLALHFAQSGGQWLQKTGYWVLAFVLCGTVLLTQSRTPLVAVAAAYLVVAGRSGRRVIAVIVLLAVAVFLLEPLLWHRLLRGLSYRPGIWLETLKQTADHLLFGAGYLSDTAVQVGERSFVHAHNAYLATLRDGGLLGLVLLLAVLGTAVFQGLRLDRRSGCHFYIALLVYGMLCAVPDLDRLLSRPREFWLFFWLPVALVMVASGPGVSGGADRPTGEVKRPAGPITP